MTSSGVAEGVEHYLECNDQPSTLCLTQVRPGPGRETSGIRLYNIYLDSLILVNYHFQGYSTFELPFRDKANLIKIGETLRYHLYIFCLVNDESQKNISKVFKSVFQWTGSYMLCCRAGGGKTELVPLLGKTSSWKSFQMKLCMEQREQNLNSRNCRH